MGDQYGQVSSYVEYLFEQYRPYMWWVLLACAGIWSIVMGVFYGIAQKNEDKEKARKNRPPRQNPPEVPPAMDSRSLPQQCKPCKR